MIGMWVVYYLVAIDLIGLSLGIYGFGMAKGWWK
jgi:hypothetical protein